MHPIWVLLTYIGPTQKNRPPFPPADVARLPCQHPVSALALQNQRSIPPGAQQENLPSQSLTS